MNKKVPFNRSQSRGAALLIVTIFFMLGSLIAILGVGRTAYYDVLRSRTLLESTQAYYVTEAGVEDVVYRLRKGKTVSASGIETLSFAGSTATTTITPGFDTVAVDTQSSLHSLYRANHVVLGIGGGASFSFGLQSSTGGISMANSSAVVGNIYSNGTVTGAGSNMVYGDVVSAGASGLVTGVHATGSAYAHSIVGATIDKDAYYQSKIGSIILGTSFPGSPDQSAKPLPITDATISDWETAAEAGGVVSSPCPYVINTNISLGPKKITCDVVIDKSSTNLTLTGPVWITGNLDTKSGPNILVDSSHPGASATIIVDNPADRLTSSKMTLDQSTGFVATTTGTYVLMVSGNNSSELGGPEVAISAGNKTTFGQREVIYYAPHGKLNASNSVKLRGATAYAIALSQSASVEYQTGMMSLLFTGGPSGGYIINSWKEVQ